MLHVLRDCPIARQFWADSGISHIDPFSSKCPAQFGLKIMPIITLWFGLSRSHGACTSCLVFGIYGFFKTRLFFKVFLTTLLVTTVESVALEFVYCIQNPSTPKRSVLIPARWERPNSCWFKLNTDGSALKYPGLAGGGDLIRNSSGS